MYDAVRCCLSILMGAPRIGGSMQQLWNAGWCDNFNQGAKGEELRPCYSSRGRMCLCAVSGSAAGKVGAIGEAQIATRLISTSSRCLAVYLPCSCRGLDEAKPRACSPGPRPQTDLKDQQVNSRQCAMRGKASQ